MKRGGGCIPNDSKKHFFLNYSCLYLLGFRHVWVLSWRQDETSLAWNSLSDSPVTSSLLHIASLKGESSKMFWFLSPRYIYLWKQIAAHKAATMYGILIWRTNQPNFYYDYENVNTLNFYVHGHCRMFLEEWKFSKSKFKWNQVFMKSYSIILFTNLPLTLPFTFNDQKEDFMISLEVGIAHWRISWNC